MQKIVNFIAVASGVVSLAVVGSGLYVYVQRDQLIDNVKSQVMEAVTGSLGSSLGGGLGGLSPAMPDGANDLSNPPDVSTAPAAPQTSPDVGMGIPSI